MNIISYQEVIDSSRKLSLTDFFEKIVGLKSTRKGHVSSFTGCPNRECGANYEAGLFLSVMRDDKHWICCHCGEKGDILNAAELYWHENANLAAIKLVESNLKPCQFKSTEDRAREELEQAKALREALIRIQEITTYYQDEDNCLDYLMIERDLPEDVIREAQQRKMLGFLPSNPNVAKSILVNNLGEDLLKRSGLWKEGSKVPAIMFRPIVFFLPGFWSAEFRIIGNPKSDTEKKSIRYGITKHPYVWRSSSEKANKAFVNEGFIDFLSSVALGFKGHVIGLPGAGNFKEEWFPYLAEKLGINLWILGLDQDNNEDNIPNDIDEIRKTDPKKYKLIMEEMRKNNPGQYWTMVLKEILDKQNQPYIQKRLPGNSDINDILRSRKAA